MLSNVTRYSSVANHTEMHPHDNGEWVTLEDYKELLAQNIALQTAMEGIAHAARNVLKRGTEG